MKLDMLYVVHHGLGLALRETDGYLQAYRHHLRQPGRLDECCSAHLAEWQRREDEVRTLEARRQGQVDAIREVRRMIEAAGGEKRGW